MTITTARHTGNDNQVLVGKSFHMTGFTNHEFITETVRVHAIKRALEGFANEERELSIFPTETLEALSNSMDRASRS